MLGDAGPGGVGACAHGAHFVFEIDHSSGHSQLRHLRGVGFEKPVANAHVCLSMGQEAVSYTHLTLPTICSV
eukprot:14117757-Alexandrium_andersonii.AAC.1